ncbi:hypothetical protein lerEdw1_003587 [Lerista edwardsae]|nr:hypothetical protein lerEdw1_003587 [Lerista edwardsae]
MVARRLFWGLLLLFRARAQDGSLDFQPSFIYMSGSMVTAFLTGSPADVFSIAAADHETGLLPLEDCSGRNRTGDWSLNVTSRQNVSTVTVRLTRSLHLCPSHLPDCCVEPLCLVEALQVSACWDSVVVARLLIQAEIYANASSGNATGKADSRKALDCTPGMKSLFRGSCFEGVFGGDVNPPFDQLCSVQAGRAAQDWFPFLCVQSPLKNTPFLGYFYHGAISPSQASAFKVPFETRTVGRLLSGYRQGDPILTLQNEHFTVPQPSLGGPCARSAPVAFLRDLSVECLAACQDGGGTTVAINSGTGDSIEPQVTHERNPTNVSSCAGRACQNVTFAEDYTVVWEGKRILAMKVTVLSGEICPEETLKQRFTVTFASVNSTSAEERSGNPGYQVGKPIRAANLNASDSVTTLKLWKPVFSVKIYKTAREKLEQSEVRISRAKCLCFPDGRGLCTSGSLVPLLFGLDSSSGCLLEVDPKENCNQLRENVTGRLNSLVQADFVGKRGNSNSSKPDDWVEILRLDALDATTNGSVENSEGTCLDIPAHLNIRIITADVGAIEGVPQQEILGVQVSFSTVTWQVQCGIVCEDNTRSLPISAAVQFIKIPAQPPVPLTRFQIDYTEYDCKRNDVCWPELFYPMTRDYTGEPYSHALAKGLVLAFLGIVAFMLSDPWSRIYTAWSRT